ncbi:restriction endonuclease subunit S [Rosenbergiella collisarenosi]|uniref:restriction endonuclease subunit S n=1 Tax=Rosenbergiella collisarenosi TaxID=1544695 RepID=UPI001BD969FA|nr:restriction endonuclease subunit S [Rosenbergiella collisarenosi]MBT0719849.1 restriction endonuclease subunit S [Rosenbergiella collisarenosi]
MDKFFRTNSSILVERLDPNFYQPRLVENDKLIKSKGWVELQSLYEASGIGNTSAVERYYSESADSIPYISGKVIKSFNIDLDGCQRISLDSHKNELTKSTIRPKDVLIIRKGDMGNACVVSSEVNEANCSSEVIYLKMKASSDPYYLVSYLNCDQGQKAFKRLGRGTIIPGVSLLDVPRLPIPKVSEFVQKYIGDKVRQAEQLRTWAKRLEQVSSFMFANALAELGYKEKKSTKIVRAKLEDRLDPAFYDEKFSLFNEFWFKSNSEPLKQFIESGSYGVLPSSNSYGKGNVRFIRATDLKNANIDPTCFNYVPEEEVADKAKVSKGDILMEIKGAISTCELAESHLAGTYINGSIFRFTPKGIDNAYLAYFLSSTIKELYCERVSVNNIISYLDLASLHELPIIRLKNDIEEFLAKNLININLAKKIAFALTRSAKTLVESLIEGQLTEQQLIRAQQALEDGDNSLDLAILSKLSAKGYAIEGTTPLFSDIDELYSLLEDAAQAEAEE